MTLQTTDLKTLGELKAPAGFADRVLAAAGLADSYAPFETVIGVVYVAWNRNGISAAARFLDPDGFEAWFRHEVGRAVVPATPPADLAAKIEDELNSRHRM